MQCSDCQFENPEGVKFCVECGSKLEAKCRLTCGKGCQIAGGYHNA